MTNLAVTERKYRDPNCPGEDCWFCSGEACLMCMGPGWYAPDCEHDVIDRHGGLPKSTPSDSCASTVTETNVLGHDQSSRTGQTD